MEIPLHLYKYRTVCDYTERIFTNAEIYAPGPDKFNDPFDCRIEVTTNGTVDDIRNALETNHPILRKMAQTQFPADDIATAARKLFEIKDELLGDSARRAFQQHVDSTGVVCFSEFWDQILMWSHYGDYHRGICLEFDTSIGGSLFHSAMAVNYSDQLPEFAYFSTDHNEQAKRSIFTKEL